MRQARENTERKYGRRCAGLQRQGTPIPRSLSLNMRPIVCLTVARVKQVSLRFCKHSTKAILLSQLREAGSLKVVRVIEMSLPTSCSQPAMCIPSLISDHPAGNSLALGFLGVISGDLKPAIPATRTDVSTTPLGRFLLCAGNDGNLRRLLSS